MEHLVIFIAFFLVVTVVFVGIGELHKRKKFVAETIVASFFLFCGVVLTWKGIEAQSKGELWYHKGEGQPPIQAIIGGGMISALAVSYVLIKKNSKET